MQSNKTFIIILVLSISLSASLGYIYRGSLDSNIIDNKVEQLDTSINNESTIVSDSKLEDTNEIDESIKVEEETVLQDTSQVGDIVVVDESTIECSNVASRDDLPCSVLAKTEIELTQVNNDNSLTGDFFIRLYEGANFIGEYKLYQDYSPFAMGDDNRIYEMTLEENKSFEITEANGQYSLLLENKGDQSGFNGRTIDFYRSESSQNIQVSFPQ